MMALAYSILRKPVDNQVVDPSTGQMKEEWALYFGDLTTRLNSAVGALATDPAPADAEYIVNAANGTLTAERVVTDTASITKDVATPAQLKLNIAAGGVGTTELAGDAVTNAKLANMAQATVKGRQAGAGTGDPEDLTAAQARTAIGAVNIAGDTMTGALQISASNATTRTEYFRTSPTDFGANKPYFAIGKGTAAEDWELILWDGSDTNGNINVLAGNLLLNSSPVVPTVVAAQATTSGTAVDFTGLPSSVSRITVGIVGVSLTTTDDILVQIGDSGGVETTGYEATSADSGATVTYTTGFGVKSDSATTPLYGSMTLTRIGGSTWVASHGVGRPASNADSSGGGAKTLTGTLDRVRVTVGGGAFDAGSVSIVYD